MNMNMNDKIQSKDKVVWQNYTCVNFLQAHVRVIIEYITKCTLKLSEEWVYDAHVNSQRVWLDF